jgi:ABC-2 type transport system permease protein
MRSLLLKEIRTFFSALTGYLVIAVFLLMNSLFLWLFPNAFNLLDSGYAGIDGLFLIAPWVFMFLIPALTMRMFADENKGGTMEFLLTKPLTDLQIISAKFLAGMLLVLFSLLPTLMYFYTIYQLGNPAGNMDVGGTLGSYLGLLFLGASYVAIGLFASSLTDNQIIAFIIAVLICFIGYFGIEQLAELGLWGNFDLVILKFGINEHYTSMSRGVVDSRDVLYFLSVIFLFGFATRLVLQSRKWS